MKTIFKIIGIALVLLIIAVALIPMLVSLDDVTGLITEQVQEATGRDLLVEGEKSLSVFPSLSLQLNQVKLSNMASGSAPHMVSMERLDVHIPWASLLSGELKIDRFVIDKPTILLETDKDGNANWDLLPATEPAPTDAEGEMGALPAGFDIKLGEVAIYGGKLSMLDHQASTEQHLNELALSIDLPSLRENLQLRGSVDYLGQTLQLDLVVSTPADAMTGAPFDLQMALESALLTLQYQGRISEGGGQVAGRLEVSGDSVKQLLAWQGQPLEAGDTAFNGFELSADILYAGDSLQLSDFNARLDELQIGGDTTLVLAEVPSIKADIDLGMLDINPYLPPPSQPTGPTPESAAASEPIVWDDTVIDLSALKSVNADISLRSSGLRARDIKLGDNALNISLAGGRATVALEKFQAYSGQGQGTVSVNASRSPYRIDTSFKLSGIDAQPLLTDVVGFDKLMGTGNLDWQLETSGASQKDFVSALAGNLGFSFTDGAIRGANIAAILRSAQGIIQGDLSKLDLDANFDAAAQTDFSEMGGTMVFRNGVGRNEDLVLASPLLRVTGTGAADLPDTRIDYTIKARLVATIQGQSAEGKAKGVGIPIKISGPFHDVKIKPDLRKATEEKVKDSIVDKIFKRFR